jgi:hypothetical protein
MSNRLAAASSLSFSTREYRDVVSRDGQKKSMERTRDIVLRRPDRFYSKQGGDRPTDTWYDGKYVTVAVHPDKVYGQVRSPDNNVDATVDALSQRYGIVLPIMDILHSRPDTLLLTDDLKGGYVETQRVEGVDCHHLSFVMPGIDWDLWIPTQGDPLPKRLKVIEKKQKGSPVADITFSNWNLAASSPDELFKPKVPEDYEGIAVLQRAGVIKADASQQPATRTRSASESARK